VEGFLPKISEQLESLSTVASLVGELRSPGKERAEKLILWAQLKNQAFIKAVVSIYSITFQILIVRLFVNILGKYTFQELSCEHKEHIASVNSFIQKEFLLVSRHLYTQGMKQLFETVNISIKRVVEGLSFDKNITMEELKAIFLKIDAEATPLILSNFANFIFPSAEEIERKLAQISGREPLRPDNEGISELDIEHFLQQFNYTSEPCVIKDDLKLKLLLNEALNDIESEEFCTLAQQMFKKSFDILLSNLGEFMSQYSKKSLENLPSGQVIPLVKLIPQISNQALLENLRKFSKQLTLTPEILQFSEEVFQL